MQVKFLRWALSGVLACMASLCLAAPPPSPQVALVSRLYQPNSIEIYNSTPRSALLQYLTPELTQLLIDDAKCEREGQGICHLGWRPIWTGNDDSGLSAQVRETSAADKVEAEIHSTYSPRIFKVIYHLKKTSRGWRIRDIEYEDRPSLFQILNRPM
jgi:hypothetical protein